MISRSAPRIVRFPVTAGFVFGVLPLPLHLLIPTQLSHELAALSLVLIAGVYPGYAFQDGRPRPIAVELVVAFCFLVVAWLGLHRWSMAIAAGFAIHALWDRMHHHRIDTAMPRWYIPFCAAYDLITAVSLAAIWTFRTATN